MKVKFEFGRQVLGVMILFLFSSCMVFGQEGKIFVVATNGSDNNPGTVDRPMATLEAARDAARVAGTGNNRIVIMPGKYFLEKTLVLDSRDNGLTIEADTTGAVILYGGTLVESWQTDGDKFWAARLSGVKERTWDFRALVVDGRMPQRARMPETGTFHHQSVFDAQWLSTVGGGWARKPTPEELITMRYNPNDIPATLDIKNAEVRVYHMWNESLLGVDNNDIEQHTLRFSVPAKHPPGGFGVKKYVVWNTREGMTKPGCWYLDRTKGQLVYWPLDNEDMTTTEVVAPRMGKIIDVVGEPGKEVENITLRGLTFQATTTPLQTAGFGGTGFDGAVNMSDVNSCLLENIEVSNVGGIGIVIENGTDCRVSGCHVHNTGACCVMISGPGLEVSRNHIHDAGLYFPSSTGLYLKRGLHANINQNEIHEIPYCGIIVGGADSSLIEGNLICRAMREMHDGAAIYCGGGLTNSILRGNVVRDIVKIGEGTGVSAYYLDEGANNCIVERNVSIGVIRPTHNHIARDCIIRDNVFMADEDMMLSFQSSCRMAFEGNTVYAPGSIVIKSPDAVSTWKGNRIFRNAKNKGLQDFTIDSLMPQMPVPEHKTEPVFVNYINRSPVLDGKISTGEWPVNFFRLDRKPTRELYSGAPVIVRTAWDKKNLYIGTIIAMFDPANISLGDKWEKDDGMEISLEGVDDNGKPVIYIIRAYADGTVQSVTDAGVSGDAAGNLAGKVKFVTKMLESPRNGWCGEWAIPFKALGLKPGAGLNIAFNMCAFVNEYDKWHCWEGTLGENWQLDQAGMLQLK